MCSLYFFDFRSGNTCVHIHFYISFLEESWLHSAVNVLLMQTEGTLEEEILNLEMMNFSLRLLYSILIKLRAVYWSWLKSCSRDGWNSLRDRSQINWYRLRQVHLQHPGPNRRPCFSLLGGRLKKWWSRRWNNRGQVQEAKMGHEWICFAYSKHCFQALFFSQKWHIWHEEKSHIQIWPHMSDPGRHQSFRDFLGDGWMLGFLEGSNDDGER